MAAEYFTALNANIADEFGETVRHVTGSADVRVVKLDPESLNSEGAAGAHWVLFAAADAGFTQEPNQNDLFEIEGELFRVVQKPSRDESGGTWIFVARTY